MCGIGALLDPAGRHRPTPAGAWPRRCAIAGPTATASARSARRRSPTPGWRSSTWRAATSRCTPRTARSPRSSTARSTTTLDLRAELEAAGPHVRHPLGLRGGGARLRGVRRGLRAAAQRHLRLRALGRPARPPRGRARPVRASSRSTGAPTGGAWRWPPRCGALLAAGLAEPRVDPVALDHYLACRFVPAPRTLFEGISKLRGRLARWSSPRTAARRDELPRGARSAARGPDERGARGRAGRALHRRGGAPDDVRRPLRRVPQRRRGLRRHRRRDGQPL